MNYRIGKIEAQPPMPSVDKALIILSLLAHHPSGMELSTIVGHTGLPKASAHRALSALRFRQFVEQDERTRRYRLGSEFVRIAFSFYSQLDIRKLVHPVLTELSEAFGESAHLGQLNQTDVVYIDKVEPARSIKLTSNIGGRNPATCTALGKAILACTYPSSESIAAAVQEGSIRFVRKTPNSIMSVEDLERELAITRNRGFAVDEGENELGVKCVAFPLMVGEQTQGAISISGPTNRMFDPNLIVEGYVDIIRRNLSESYLPKALRAEKFHDSVAKP